MVVRSMVGQGGGDQDLFARGGPGPWVIRDRLNLFEQAH
jgi:hypothetical protein